VVDGYEAGGLEARTAEVTKISTLSELLEML
jgi:hypothetical protein